MRLSWLLLACSTVACSSNDSPVSPTDGGSDVAVVVEHDDPCGPDPTGLPDKPVPSTRVSTFKSKKAPLAKAGAGGPSEPGPLASYLAQGFGDLEKGPAEEGVVVDTLLPGAGPSAGKAGRKSVAYIAHLSDLQLIDDESPIRLMKLDNPISPGAARPAEASIALATSAMHRTLAKITASRPFDFELISGDCVDNAQENEIAWFVDLMDGKAGLHIDSGDDDDPVVGAHNDPKDPFDPVPAPAPWFFVFGNHDVETVGTTVPDDLTRISAIGTEPRNGTRDYRLKGAPSTRESVPADPKRRPLVRGEIVQALQKSTSMPAGHGFAGIAVSGPPANYVVDPIAGVPIRLVQLDTNDPWGGSDGMVEKKTVDEFLEPVLTKADTEGRIVILSSHHATTNIDPSKGLDGPAVPGALTGKELEAVVAKHPSVVLWLVGHNHINRVRAIAGPSTDAPGYYEVMTDAIADWPSQARAIELVTLPDGTLSIFMTMIDYEARTCLEERYRKLTLVDVNSAWSWDGTGAKTDRNVELRRVLPKGVSLAGLGRDKIETETTLLGK